jgi:hypothetical protein
VEVGNLKQDLYGNQFTFSKMITLQRQPVFDRYYKLIGRFAEGRAPLLVDTAWGYIDTNGHWAIEPIFEAASPFSAHLAAAQMKGQWGYVTQQGSWQIEPRFQAARPFQQNHAVVQSQGQWGVINSVGQWVIEPSFEALGHLQNGMIPFQQQGDWGVRTLKGKTVLQPVYDRIEAMQGGYFRFIRERKGYHVGLDGERKRLMLQQQGLLGPEGNILHPPVLEWIGPFADGLAPVRASQDRTKIGYMNLAGAWVWKPRN